MKLHHIGIVVKNIESAIPHYCETFELVTISEIFHDSIQKVSVQFLGNLNSPLLELIQPDSSDSTVSNFLSKGGGLYHLCFEVEDLEVTLRKARECGGIIVKGPDPATAFEHRTIAFVVFRDLGLIEYLQK